MDEKGNFFLCTEYILLPLLILKGPLIKLCFFKKVDDLLPTGLTPAKIIRVLKEEAKEFSSDVSGSFPTPLQISTVFFFLKYSITIVSVHNNGVRLFLRW